MGLVYFLCAVQTGDAVPERATVIAQASDDGNGGVGFSLANQPFDKTIEDNDTAERLLLKSSI